MCDDVCLSAVALVIAVTLYNIGEMHDQYTVYIRKTFGELTHFSFKEQAIAEAFMSLARFIDHVESVELRFEPVSGDSTTIVRKLSHLSS